VDNVELIESGYEALNRGDADAAAELAAPDCVARTRFAALAGRTYRGRQGIDEWFADVAEAWEAVEQVPERFIEIDPERTIAVVRFKARSRESGAEVEQIFATVWTIRDGRATSIDTYDSLDEALDAVAGSTYG
jgi:ketosteroid isomerase-like protein